MNVGGRRACAVVIVAVTALLGATTTPAHAVSAGPLVEDAARVLPKLRPVKFRLPRVRLTAPGEAEYGINDTTVIAQLNNAKTEEVNAVDSAVSSVGSAADSPEVKDAAEECAKESFKKTAEEYVNAAEQGTTYPFFDNAFYIAVYGCLAGNFPDAPPDAVNTVARYLTGRVSQPAQGAVSAAPTAFANWLAATGDEVGASSAGPDSTTPTEPSPPPDSDSGRGDSDGGGGSSFPWWLVLVGVLGVVGYLVYRSRQS